MPTLRADTAGFVLVANTFPSAILRRSRAAFTIVELLVTIGIVALLIGLLAPALASSAAASRALRCQANLRQMAIACNNYAAMFDAFVPAVRYEMRSGTLHRIEWDWVTTFNNQLVAPGPLWNFTDHPGETQQCPEFTGSSNSGGDPFTGYNYNTTYIGGEGLFPNLGWSHFRKGAPPHTCSRASSCAMFGDGGKKGGANKFMRAPLRSEGLGISLEAVYSGGQAFRHARATNIAFVDGHVGAVNKPRPGQLATPQLLNNFMDFPRNGFLSDDDRAYDPK